MRSKVHLIMNQGNATACRVRLTTTLAGDAKLEKFTGAVADSGEGRWTIEAAIETATPANVLSAALFERFRSRQEHSFGDQLLSALRFGFGGHVEPKA